MCEWIILKAHFHNSTNPLMTCWQAVLNRYKVCLVNEISVELHPFNILNMHCEEIFLEISSCHLGCKLPWALRFWRAKRSHPCKYGNCSSIPFVCSFSFVWMFFSLCCFCQHIRLPGERDGEKGFTLARLYLLQIWDGALSYQTGVLSAAFAHYITWNCSHSSLPATQTPNQALLTSPAQICPEPKQWLHIWLKLSSVQNLTFWHLLRVEKYLNTFTQVQLWGTFIFTSVF